jgi:hypothetical protein
MRAMPEPLPARWLLLIHEIPPRPSYLRVKVGRRLRALGAVAVKNSVYILPRSEAALEDFQWVRREIVDGRGEATVCEASFVEGLSDAAVERMFNQTRDAEYGGLGRDVQRLQGALKRRAGGAVPPASVVAVERLRKRWSEIAALDFFGAPGGKALDRRLAELEAGLRSPAAGRGGRPRLAPADYRARTWVTRRGVQVDRIASAWLIRRFIDPEARFAFRAGDEPRAAGEVRFDMFEAEFTHEGPLCTFEVLRERFGLKDAALRHVAEVVHDVDLKDARFGRAEAPGMERLVAGLARRHADDEDRLREGAALFESLYESFKGQG